MSFINSTIGIVTTYDGKVYRTNSSGQSRMLQYTALINVPLTQVLFTSPAVGYAVGGELSCSSPGCPPGGLVLKTVDGGITWAVVYQNSSSKIVALALNASGELLAATNGSGGSQIVRSANGGITWTPTDASSFSAQVINSLTPTRCLIFGGGRYSGGDFGTFSGSLRQTADAGSNWTGIELTTVNTVHYTSFYTAHDGYAIAGNALLKVTVK